MRSILPRLFAAALACSWLLPNVSTAFPRPPTNAEIQRLQALSVIGEPSRALTLPLTVDTASREETRQFYRVVFSASNDVPIGWTGDINTGDPGDTSAAFKDAVMLRVNYHRAMAGVPALVVLNNTFSAKAQDAALMMSANNSLNHFPPPGWIHYTADGAEAASKSNLALGNNGPDSITFGYIADSGSNNTVVGHRRWVLYPQWQEGGTGDVAASGPGQPASNALWVQDSNVFSPRPMTRDTFVAWPAPGYVPYQVVFPRWSLSYPNADFTGATVAMTRDGANVPVTYDHRGSGGGAPEASIVWVYDNLDTNASTSHVKPTGDTTYHVEVGNVLISGSPQTFEYDVIVFDPDVAGPDFDPVEVSGSGSPVVGADNAYSVAYPSFADGFQWRSLELSAFGTTYAATGDLQGVIAATTGSYTPRVTLGGGNAAYHLVHETPENQYLTLPDTFFLPAGDEGDVTFQSRLGWATTIQVARVQVSLDEGVSWTDIYMQAGSDGAGEGSFVARNAPLDEFAGQTFHVRFAYTFPGSGSRFNQTDNDVGWLIDNITLTGVQSASVQATSAIDTGTSFAFNPATEQEYGLQARGVLFMELPMQWGPVIAVDAIAAGIPLAPTGTSRTDTNASGFTATWEAVATATGYRLDVATDAGFASLVPGFADLDVGNVTGFDVTGLAAGAYHLRVRAYNTEGTSTSSESVLIGVGGRVTNLSTRGRTGVDAETLIVGFVIKGNASKDLLIRAAGPTLDQRFGVVGTVPNPRLALFTQAGALIPPGNDDWDDTDQALLDAMASVFAFSYTKPSQDAAMLVSLAPGIYSVHVQSVTGAAGVTHVELYELDGTSELINISTRAFVGDGDAVLIPGTFLGTAPKRVLVRAVGETLGQPPFNIPGVLEDPIIEVVRLNAPTPDYTNDDWGSDGNVAEIEAARQAVFGFGLPQGSKDAVVLADLPSGGFTFVVKGKNGATGVVLFELYVVP